jgi:hypothetical protein
VRDTEISHIQKCGCKGLIWCLPKENLLQLPSRKIQSPISVEQLKTRPTPNPTRPPLNPNKVDLEPKVRRVWKEHQTIMDVRREKECGR